MNIIKAPIVSEKATELKTKRNTYLFKVDVHANKHQVAQAITAFFSVVPLRVRTAIVKGKKRPLNKWHKVKYGPDWKKAYVTLKKGEKIKELE